MILKKENISRFIDTILIFVVTLFFATVSASYFVQDLTTILFAGITGAFALTGMTIILQKKRKPQYNPEIQKTLIQFIYNTQEYCYDFVCAAFETKYKVVKMDGYFLVNSTAVFVSLKNGKVTSDRLAGFYANARKTAKKIIVLSVDGAANDCASLIKALPDPAIVIFDGAKVYSLLRWLGQLPKEEIQLKKYKKSIKDFFKGALSPSRARGYFFTALTLILPSLVFRHSIYYIASALVCIALGILAKINIIELVAKKRVNS